MSCCLSGSSVIPITRLCSSCPRTARARTRLPLGASRELLEETGAVGHSYYPLGQLYPSPGYCAEIIHLYFCRIESVEQPSPDEDEFLSIEKIPLEKRWRWCSKTKFRTQKTQTAVLKTALLFKARHGMTAAIKAKVWRSI